MARDEVHTVEIDGVWYARGVTGELTWRRGRQSLRLSRQQIALPPGADGPAAGEPPTLSPIEWIGVEVEGWVHVDDDGRPTGLHVCDYDVQTMLESCRAAEVVAAPGWGTISLHGYLLLSQIHGAGVALVVRAGLVAAEGVWRDVLSRYAGQDLLQVTAGWTPSTGAAVQHLARAHAIADARAIGEGAASREAIGARDRLASARAVAAAALGTVGGGCVRAHACVYLRLRFCGCLL